MDSKWLRQGAVSNRVRGKDGTSARARPRPHPAGLLARAEPHLRVHAGAKGRSRCRLSPLPGLHLSAPPFPLIPRFLPGLLAGTRELMELARRSLRSARTPAPTSGLVRSRRCRADTVGPRGQSEGNAAAPAHARSWRPPAGLPPGVTRLLFRAGGRCGCALVPGREGGAALPEEQLTSRRGL